MHQTYFVAYCNMDHTHLRSNILFHSCLVFFEGQCDEEERPIGLIRVTGSFSFYSHVPPRKIPCRESGKTFFAQSVMDVNIRASGSYGEWKEEDLHDLCFGKGLTGRLFEIDIHKRDEMLQIIQSKINAQTDFFRNSPSIQAKETHYRAFIQAEKRKLNEAGLSSDNARKQAYHDAPVAPFYYSFTGDGSTCKISILEVLEAGLIQKEMNPATQQRLQEQLQDIRGFFTAKSTPRWSGNLDKFIITAYSDRWEARGKENQYTYLSWTSDSSDPHCSITLVNFGGHYVNKSGVLTTCHTLDKSTKDAIIHLKIIERICQIAQHEDPFYQQLHRKINTLILSVAHQDQKNERDSIALQETLCELVNDPLFVKISQRAPVNLKPYLAPIIEQYTRIDGAMPKAKSSKCCALM